MTPDDELIADTYRRVVECAVTHWIVFWQALIVDAEAHPVERRGTQRCKTPLRAADAAVLVMQDPEDQLALQAWVDVEVGGATVRLLRDTGSGTTAVPWSAAVGAPFAETTAPSRGASGGTVDGWHGVITRLSLPGAHTCDELAVDVQPAGWPHAPLLGRDVFEDHPSSIARWAEDHPEAIVLTDDAIDGSDVTGTSVAALHGQLNSYTIADLEFPRQACAIVDLSGLNAHMDEPIRFALGLPQIVLANRYLDFRTQRLAVYPLA